MNLKTNSGTVLILIVCFVVTSAIASYSKQQTHLPLSSTKDLSLKSQSSNSETNTSLNPTNINIDNDLQVDNSEQPVQPNVESAANVLLEQINEDSNLTLNDNNSSVPDEKQQLKFQQQQQQQQQDSEDGQVEKLGPLASGFAEDASSSIPANLQENSITSSDDDDKRDNNHVSNSLNQEVQPLDNTESNHIFPLHTEKYKSIASGTAKGLRTARNSIDGGHETNDDDEIDDTVGAKQQTKLATRQDGLVVVPNAGFNFDDLNAAAGHHYKKKKKKKKVIIKKKKKKVKIVKKVKKKKKVYVKKVKKVKKHKKKKKKHHSVKHHHHGGGGGGGYGKYYMYAKVPKKKAWEFGYKKGNKKHTISRHEKGYKSKFKTKVTWHDKKSKGKGVHIWDYNHTDKKKKKKHH